MQSGSVIIRRKEPIKVTVTEKNKTANAFLNNSVVIVCLKSSTFFLPRMVDQTVDKTIAKVEVFIPPPVEPDDAPMNIRKSMKKRIGFPS